MADQIEKEIDRLLVEEMEQLLIEDLVRPTRCERLIRRLRMRSARARALGSSPDRSPVTPVSVVDIGKAPDGEVVRIENLPAEKRSFFERLSSESILDQDNTKAVAAVAGASIGVAVASAVGIANLKSAAIGAGALYVGWKSLPVVDWFARGMDQLADKMIDKKLPGVKFITSLLDKSAKWMGVDKSLYEHLKKNKEDRVKLADKLLKELRASEKKYESKLDAAEKKQKRQKVLESKLGKDVADLLGDELDEASKKEETPVAVAA
ncbi:hypothetical protein COV05_03065 [Candidatus Uhrbacteria bacterium CG10_big_fil_rev_8_21_14_0_10_48_16]|uniref:Uncharacterized protein n=1 Tax=Candidatus Uhrbacteria bacterium CG10_big_fil_rev_8_21_14_0_10_48_16 TaxID=1975038 RepID=A0A2M8LGZ9_9BACT|nr:MAG: hypothetical protein COV05_03065 [Candidatus Uhrbacteria bacterium CG10_big_fil_rev_8_21_14_0_10_48_16]